MRRTLREIMALPRECGTIDDSYRPRLVAHNTAQWRAYDGTVRVRLHVTDVVTYHKDGRVSLNSGGWRTVTTKDRLNTFSDVGVWSNRGEWWCQWREHSHRAPIPFYDGITFDAEGNHCP